MRRKAVWSIVVALAAAGCGGAFQGATFGGSSTPAVPLVTFDVVACAEQTAPNACERPIGGATMSVQLQGATEVVTADAAGFHQFTVPGVLRFTHIVVRAEGYLERALEAFEPAACVNGCHNIVVLQPAHVDPATFTDAQLRHVQTSMAGVYLEEIRPQCPEDPVTHIRCVADIGTPRGIADGILFTANYRLYTAAQRQVIRDVFTGKRPDKFGRFHHFTHYVISLFCRDVPDYHGVYPPCTTAAKVSLNDALHELIDDQLIPMGFVMHDDEPDDASTPLSVEGLVDPALVPLVSPYWEHYEVDCAMQKVRALFPKALLYYHNPANTDAGYPDRCYAGSDAQYGALGGGRGWWEHFKNAYRGAGVWMQNDQGTVDDVRARLADFVIRFQFGYHAWPIGLDTVWFEDTNTVFDNFWQGGDEAANERRADQVLVMPLCGEASLCGSVAGYASGSSR
jgi:hypothetical protein